MNKVRDRFYYAPDDGSGSGGGQGDKEGGKNTAGDFVPKAEFDKFKGDHEKMKQDLEDARLEMMSPEYLEFLSSKSSKKEEATKPPPVSDDEFSKMTPKQLYERAKADALAEAKKEVDEFKKSDETRNKEKIQVEIKQFAETHADFKDYQSIMHSFTFDPKHAHKSLQQLYDEAKAYVKRLSGTPSPEEKAKGNRAKGEKPGGSSGTYKKNDKTMTAEQAGDEAWEEVVGDSALPGT